MMLDQLQLIGKVRVGEREAGVSKLQRFANVTSQLQTAQNKEVETRTGVHYSLCIFIEYSIFDGW